MNLPMEGPEKELERKSIDELRRLFHKDFHPQNKFIVSSEKIEDYGVDCKIILKINYSRTNFSFNVQVKAIDKSETNVRNTDGSFSKQISTSNVNFLMQTTKSLYILYVKSENEFYYEWADMFFLKLHKKDKNWNTKSGTKVLRFSKKIDDEALQYIFNEVWVTCRAVSKFALESARLKHLTNPKSPNISINVNNLEVKSEHDIIEFI